MESSETSSPPSTRPTSLNNMANPKTLFLRNNDDVKAALGIVKSDAFEKLITFARAEFSASNPSAEQGRGATMFEAVLRGMPIDEVEIPSWDEVTSGERLDHELSIPIRHADKPKEEPKDKK